MTTVRRCIRWPAEKGGRSSRCGRGCHGCSVAHDVVNTEGVHLQIASCCVGTVGGRISGHKAVVVMAADATMMSSTRPACLLAVPSAVVAPVGLVRLGRRQRFPHAFRQLRVCAYIDEA